MKCSVFIATSADGYIATLDGGVGWLDTAGKPDADLGDQADMGFYNFFASVDCMIMGRHSMEKLASFDLTPEQWPYGNTRIIALSKTISEAPENMKNRVELYAGEISQLIDELKNSGFKHAWIDGGAAITSFLNENLINEIIITQAPLLLGSGIPLFGELTEQIKLANAGVTVFGNDFVQTRYDVIYA